MTQLQIPTVVAACFYSELCVPIEPVGTHSEGRAAFDFWSEVFRLRIGDEPETVKMREDLEACGVETFSRCWAFLLAQIDRYGRDEVFALLHRHYGRIVAEGFARRDQRRGKA